jgi:hypothetical protein
MKNNLQWFFAAVCIGFGAGLGMAVYNYTGLPFLYQSYSTGECLEVVTADGVRHGCDNPPLVYIPIWRE